MLRNRFNKSLHKAKNPLYSSMLWAARMVSPKKKSLKKATGIWIVFLVLKNSFENFEFYLFRVWVDWVSEKGLAWGESWNRVGRRGKIGKKYFGREILIMAEEPKPSRDPQNVLSDDLRKRLIGPPGSNKSKQGPPPPCLNKTSAPFLRNSP